MKTIPQHTLDFIDSWLKLRCTWAGMPGFSIAIAKDGKVIFDKAYGFADIKNEKKLTTKHLFRIASHSKTFTATAILQLQEQGKLRIDDPVAHYLGWLNGHKDRRWHDVTIRQILSHSAGIIRDGQSSDFWQLAKPFPNKEELKSAILESQLILEPNTKMKYSNFGFSLLGEVVESASGIPYNKYVTEHIIKVLGLKNTTPEYDDKRLFTKGYSRRNPDYSRYELPIVSTQAMSPATGFCSTSSDLAKYFSAHMIGTDVLLKDTSKREMQRLQCRVSDDEGWYCLGLAGKEWGGRTLLGHGGGFPGGITRTWFDPEDKLVVVVLTNCHGGEAMQLNRSIYSIIDMLGSKEPNESLLRYETIMTYLGGITQYVATPKGLVSIYPNMWFPFTDAETFEKIDNTTFKIKNTVNGYYSEGELVSFKFDKNGKIESVIDAGISKLPTIDGAVPITWR